MEIEERGREKKGEKRERREREEGEHTGSGTEIGGQREGTETAIWTKRKMGRKGGDEMREIKERWSRSKGRQIDGQKSRTTPLKMTDGRRR